VNLSVDGGNWGEKVRREEDCPDIDCRLILLTLRLLMTTALILRT